ncbi:MAG: TRAP transporter small permease [Candidatus Heteroscillospira sp.]|jgi:TRAP-type C4-dicarboxylate transport system permease small subunit
MKWLHKLSDALETVTMYFLAVVMATMTVVVFAQVVARLTAGSIKWSEELARYLMVYLCYVGASIGVKKKSHIAIEFVTGKFPRKVQDAVEILANLLCLVCCGIILYYGMRLVDITMMQKTPAMRIPMGYAYFSMVLGGGLMTIQFINNTVDCIVDLFRKNNGQEVNGL